MTKEVRNQHFTGERAVFQGRDLSFSDCLFDDGESPLKESANIEIENCAFGWKYPLWYSKNIRVQNSLFKETARAGVWYTENISVENTPVLAPKNFRRCKNLTIVNAEFPRADETLWACEQVTLENIHAKGNYFGMNCADVQVSGLRLDGDYAFDGARNITIRDSVLNTKDAFWNCKNVTLIDCVIVGEYFGWNSENVTLINCTVESVQGFCYMKNLRLENCVLAGTTLSFEYCSEIDAEIKGKVDSIKNPISGKITVAEVGELILESDKIDPRKTKIIVRNEQ